MRDIALIVIIIISFLLQNFSSYAQAPARKEVLIIGTMHSVPDIVKHSYKPLLRKAKAYQPEAIYVESPQASDTLSLNNTYPGFLDQVDSLKQVWELTPEKLARAQCKPLEAMQREDFEILRQHYLLQLDRANAAYYKYLYKFGRKGSPKPTQEEDGDLTAKLAIHLGLKTLRSMDNQWYRQDYHRAWAACNKMDREDGEIVHLKKILSSLKLPQTIAGLTGRLGMHVNSKNATTKYHITNSFRYRETACAPCTEGQKLWDARNLEMARNIGNQIRENTETRSIVIVGAGHVFGLQEALAQEYPDIEVKLLR
ncbi:DUF5694 domain-containing protein [Flavilitoribacter nigricans]|uniref:Uncharacterized protein n=1 Tax=Flavilitoribacter nigricans (strain ATCC 23147 / DSM 23189 / NBRC 102662 / NCIMB 1420 / SS-2) TaxID=1122177 RepID=A0A2D0NBM2_FLAN2|nr:DUF5694 domain-containing protein [Flavilitoribacter nigricans]PHN05579.1 hypothetical protein CRP01_16455 [Flavilitoribacter nigricans DSM 23189 = NBRC 102662]